MGGICEDAFAEHILYYNTPMYGAMDLITICPVAWNMWRNSATLREFNNDDIAPGSTHISEIGLKSFATGLLHEISHSSPITVGDSTSDIPDDAEDAYGWDAITYHANNNPENAVKNADNFAYYVTGESTHSALLISSPIKRPSLTAIELQALWLDNWYWDTGFNTKGKEPLSNWRDE
ncbi:hypothetical protein VTO42DRAFT_8013 [Malbranchea cinnamomea]